MTVIDSEKYFSQKDNMLEFIDMNADQYGERVTMLKFTLDTDLSLALDRYNEIPVSLKQILSKFGVLKNGCDEYLEMFKLLEEYSFLEGNCCEVGAGIYPRLAELVWPQLKLRNGSLTIYEPNILLTPFDQVTIVKDKFTGDTNIDSIDTLFALYPCQASIAIAEKAFQEDKNLMLAFCGCNHSTKEHPKWFGKYWAEDFCDDYKEKYGDEVEIIPWPAITGNDLPIMVRRSSKQKEKLLEQKHIFS